MCLTTSSVETSPLIGNTFTNSYQDWKEGTYDNFNNWALKQFGINELDSDEENEIPVHFQKAKDIEFETNRAGYLILPPLTNYKTIRQKQRVVRGYIGANYSQYNVYPFFELLLINLTGEFTESKRASFPYILAAKEGQKIYSPDSAPDGFVLSDPDHLNGSQIEALYRHWLRRQQKKLQPFVILNGSPQHQTSRGKVMNTKGKKKADYVEVNTDEEEVKSVGGDNDGDDRDESDEENEDGEKNISQLKRGPPIGRPKNSLASTNPVAGPSTFDSKTKKQVCFSPFKGNSL